MLNKQKTNKKRQSGFTLVELSIVLVIIGLIISSVLVGQDLVRSAELRATMTQLEGFNAAIGTFKGKYNGLPGDVPGATNFGFVGDGDNNGLLNNVCGGATGTCTGTVSMGAAKENNYFWNHLGSSAAALISGSYTGNVSLTNTVATISGALPAAKAGNYWGVFAGGTTTGSTATAAEGGTLASEAGTNFYILGVIGDATTARMTTGATLTALEAQNIDTKMDDGKPSTGTVRARGAGVDLPDTAPLNHTAATAADCVKDATAADAYTGASMIQNTYYTQGTTLTCTLRFKMPL